MATHPALFNLGFRPFFLGAAACAALVMAVWVAALSGILGSTYGQAVTAQWHAHEMLYGYAMAVIAGFLLTAVRNWTGEQTPQGWPLAALFSLWLAARLALLFGLILPAAVADLAFGLLLLIAVSLPIIRVRQTRQIGILSKVLLMLVGNTLFYLGVLTDDAEPVRLSLYGGLFLIVALILTMARRLIPFFVHSALEIELPNHRALDLASLFAVLLFFILELTSPGSHAGEFAAAVVCVSNALRLIIWNRAGVWQRPLLWSLYLAMWCMTAGFALLAVASTFGVSRLLGVHALAIGGIGLITVGMMGRVALGHTGRNLAEPPRLLSIALLSLFAGAITRVIMPLLSADNYMTWMYLSGALWVIGFALFMVTYVPVLLAPRPDGRPG